MGVVLGGCVQRVGGLGSATFGGRRAARDVGSLGAGRHAVEFVPAHRLAPGIYLVRLTQGDGSRIARVAVLN